MAPKPTKVYTPLMRFEKYLFAIEDFKLPIPLTFRQAGILISSFVLVLILGQMPLIGNLINGPLILLCYIGIPIAATWYLTKTNIDGKPPLTFISDLISYQFTKGIFNRYEKIDKPSKYKYTTSITYRKGENE